MTATHPPGWNSKEAKAERAAVRAERRRHRMQAEAARRRRQVAKAAAIASEVARFMGPTNVRVGKLVLAAAIKRAKEKIPKKARKPKEVAQVVRTGDVIAAMFRRGIIDHRGRRAAEHYREAYDTVAGHGMSGTLNPDKTSGGGAHGRPPPEAVMVAADVLNSAARLLGRLDGLIVAEIVGKGRSVEEVARHRYGQGASKDKIGRVRERLKDALAILADEWFPPSRERDTIRGDMVEGAKPIGTTEFRTTIERSRVVHAGPSGVAYSAKSR